MNPHNAKQGLEVRIKPDISRTVAALNGNSDMFAMAGNKKSYEIHRVNNNSKHGVTLSINRYSWLPVDIIDMTEGITDPVSLDGEKVTFDPGEM